MTTHTLEPPIEPDVWRDPCDRLFLPNPHHPAVTIPAAGDSEPLLEQFLALLAGIAWRLACEPSTDVQSAISKHAA